MLIIKNLDTLYSYRELLREWMLKDLKVRYKQSFLGGAWAILQPLSLMIVFSVVFTKFVKMPSGGIPYPVFSYVALLPWTFFAGSISLASQSLVQNMNLVTKSYFPREILPVSVVMVGLVDFLVGSIILIGMIFFYQIKIQITVLMLPCILLFQTLLTFGIVLITSALNVFYRDIRFIIPLGLQLWMYATPIIYPITSVPERFRGLYMLNPMAGIIESYRLVTLQGIWPDWRIFGYIVLLSISIFCLGYVCFKRVEWKFPDLI
jgi:lipopolysaccharide transport system permease protein